MKIKIFNKTKNKIKNIKSLIPKSFLFPKQKPNDFYIKTNFATVQAIFNNDKNSEAFIYTIMHILNTCIIDKNLKEEIFKMIIYDYLEQFLLEEKILLLQSNIIKNIKNIK